MLDKKPNIHLFEVYDRKFLYDVDTNSIVSVPSDVYSFLRELTCCSGNSDISNKLESMDEKVKQGIMYLENQGLLHPFNDNLQIKHIETDIIGIQKMVHVAQAKQFYEQDYYTPSDDGFKVFETEFGKLGIVVCFDRHYPESIRTETLMGADIILIPTVNTKTEPSEMFEWELRVQAFHNSVAIAMCNRVGSEGEMDFSGESIVVDVHGDVIAKANDTEQILYVDVDMQESNNVRKGTPYTSLRRVELYK